MVTIDRALTASVLVAALVLAQLRRHGIERAASARPDPHLGRSREARPRMRTHDDEIFVMVTPAALDLVKAVHAGDEDKVRDLMLDWTDRDLWAPVLALPRWP